MCGRLNVTDQPGLNEMMADLGLPFYPDSDNQLIQNRCITFFGDVSIVRESEGNRVITPAKWHLLLDETELGFKPRPRRMSINTRSDGLRNWKKAGYQPYKSSRCIIPVAGFGETEGKVYHDFQAVEGEGIALGGLYKEHIHSKTGEVVYSCSVITLGQAEWLKPYHSKASPLMLPNDKNTRDMWLDSSFNQVDAFNDLLEPGLVQDLVATPIDKPTKYNAVGESFVIKGESGRVGNG